MWVSAWLPEHSTDLGAWTRRLVEKVPAALSAGDGDILFGNNLAMLTRLF
ncbi:hypothetical protein X734_20700 [Mesorhizobium sp. L2C084A000]|nr:hypothetical protein X734_20700 [Mesorhizobium sp. L2C084A000]